MKHFDLGNINRHPHLRFDPLRREWVQVSPQRTARPWHGQVDNAQPADAPAHEPACDLCPGNKRTGGPVNPAYESTFVFENDFAALLPSTPAIQRDDSGLLVARTERGVCKVVCFSPRHDLTLARMDVDAIRTVIDVWTAEYESLSRTRSIASVLIFENRGAMMGASNPHPHGQIWATQTLPNESVREQASLLAYRASHGRCLLCACLALEARQDERIVCENDAFMVIVPFWAVWPFETLLVSKRHVGSLDRLSEAERQALAAILKSLTTRYDNLFETPFPYSMGFHQRPAGGEPHDEWHLHAHFYPPLLRSATVRKFMVGYEMLATPQRDVTAEAAADRLREVGEQHYLDRRS